jgi:hypothetical protein
MSPPSKTSATDLPINPGLARVIEHIVATTPPARLFELYYWAQDPRLLKLFRGFATLDSSHQEALVSLFELVRNGTAISTRWGPRGELVLELKHTGEDSSMHRYAIDGEDPLDTRGPKSH